MKKLCKIIVSTVLSFVLMTAHLYCWASGEAPQIQYVSKTAQPGDVINIYGVGFTDATPKMQVLTALNSTSGTQYELTALNHDDTTIQCKIPQEAEDGIYAIWVEKDGYSSSKTKYINAPDVSDISHTKARNNQTVRLFGENMANPKDGGMGTVYLTSQSNVVEVIPSAVTEYTADFVIPDNLTVGTEYTVTYTNGIGKELCKSVIECGKSLTITQGNSNIDDLINLEIDWGAEISETQINIEDYGAKGDGETNDTDAFKAAVDAASGKILYMPKGTYLIDAETVISNSVIIKGDGKDKTFIENTGNIQPAYSRDSISRFIVINSDNVGFADLSIVNEVERPEDEWRPHMMGWYRMIVAGIAGSSGNQRGFFLKNVDITNVDGCGVGLYNLTDVDIDGCSIDVTHTAVYGEVGNTSFEYDMTRIKNTSMKNTQRVGLWVSSHLWLEGCTFEGSPAGANAEPEYDYPSDATADDKATYTTAYAYWNAKADEGITPTFDNRIQKATEFRTLETDGLYSYMSDNTFTGRYGTESIKGTGMQVGNDGEGICFQIDRNVSQGMVTDATENTFTASVTDMTEDALKGSYVIITSGRGCGQMRKISVNTSDTVTIEKEWDIIPDSTSGYTVQKDPAYKNIIVNNKFTAKIRKANVFFYKSAIDNVVADNVTEDGCGVFFIAQVNAYDQRSVAYFNRVLDNKISRDAYSLAYVSGYDYVFGVGTYNDAGYSYMRTPNVELMLVLCQEYRGNKVKMLNSAFYKEGTTSYTSGYSNYNAGLTVSSNVGDGLTHANGNILQGNTVTDMQRGVYMGNTAANTAIVDNTFTRNVKGAIINDIANYNTYIDDNKITEISTEEEYEHTVVMETDSENRCITISGASSSSLSGKPIAVIAYDIEKDDWLTDIERDLLYLDVTQFDSYGQYKLTVYIAEGQTTANAVRVKVVCEDEFEYEAILNFTSPQGKNKYEMYIDADVETGNKTAVFVRRNGESGSIEDSEGVIIIASYNDNKLVKVETMIFEDEETNRLEKNLEKDVGGRLFIWKDLKTLVPLSDVLKY